MECETQTLVEENPNVQSHLAKRDYPLNEIEALESKCLELPQIPVPLEHMFAPGVYVREVTMPADTFIIGHQHKTEHFNVILTGRASVLMDGVVHEIVAPAIIKSGVNVRKILYIHETMRWITIHPTEETDVQKLEEMLIVKSDTFLQNETRKQLEDFRKILIDNKENNT